jgi:hypothetical protein
MGKIKVGSEAGGLHLSTTGANNCYYCSQAEWETGEPHKKNSLLMKVQEQRSVYTN